MVQLLYGITLASHTTSPHYKVKHGSTSLRRIAAEVGLGPSCKPCHRLEHLTTVDFHPDDFCQSNDIQVSSFMNDCASDSNLTELVLIRKLPHKVGIVILNSV